MRLGLPSAHSLLGKDLIERLNRAVREGNQCSLAMDVGPLNQPWLRGPTMSAPSLGIEHGGRVMYRVSCNILGLRKSHEARDRRALPRRRRDTERFQCLHPESCPIVHFCGSRRRSLRPHLVVVVQIAVQPDMDCAHVGHAFGLLRTFKPGGEVRHHHGGNDDENHKGREDLDQGEASKCRISGASLPTCSHSRR